MTKQEQEFLASFKAGEYAQLTLLVDTVNLNQLIEVLRNSGLKLAVLPKVQAEIDYSTDDNSKSGVS